MKDKYKILGILPARSGSKGIPGKNLRVLHGKPLIYWAANAMKNCTKINRKICSTNDKAISNHAKKYGLEIPFIRPQDLAMDDTNILDVVDHALKKLDDPKDPFTHIILVQATTPSVTTEILNQAIELALNSGADTIISGFLSKSSQVPLMFTLDNFGNVEWVIKNGKHQSRRQDFDNFFIRTGLFYMIKTDVIRNKKSLYGEIVQAIVVDESKAITIDEEVDFIRAKKIMKELYD
jgi:CMP-N,N'-diacetyllegionaminic acid synthase